MLTNYGPNRNVDDVTDTEIYAAIRYLEVYRGQLDQQNPDDQDVAHDIAISVCLSIALLLADFWFYWH